jgi:hypothetical protein
MNIGMYVYITLEYCDSHSLLIQLQIKNHTTYRFKVWPNLQSEIVLPTFPTYSLKLLKASSVRLPNAKLNGLMYVHTCWALTEKLLSVYVGVL